MPLWDFNLTANALTQQEKERLAENITKIYTNVGLPAFYVAVRFTERQPESSFVGGKKDSNSIHLQIYHLARHFTSDKHKKSFLDRADAVLNPVLEPKNIYWEYFVQESDRDLWKINGLVPPPSGSEMEKNWARLNRPVPEQGKL